MPNREDLELILNSLNLFSNNFKSIMNIGRTIKSMLFPVLIAGFTGMGCASQKAQKTPDHSFTAITFGKTGGVTNIPDSYSLTAGGIVSRLEKEEPVEIGQVRRSTVRKIERKIEEMDFMSMDLRETGNMTYFIEVIAPSGNQKITWTHSTEAPEAMELYRALTETVK